MQSLELCLTFSHSRLSALHICFEFSIKVDWRQQQLREAVDQQDDTEDNPLHEAAGNTNSYTGGKAWFWWGAKGPEVAAELFRFMFRYYTQHHHLDNLIWVWNSPLPEGYVGDEYCDIISRDLYTEPHVHGAYEKQYEELRKVTKQSTMTAA